MASSDSARSIYGTLDALRTGAALGLVAADDVAGGDSLGHSMIAGVAGSELVHAVLSSSIAVMHLRSGVGNKYLSYLKLVGAGISVLSAGLLTWDYFRHQKPSDPQTASSTGDQKSGVPKTTFPTRLALAVIAGNIACSRALDGHDWVNDPTKGFSGGMER